MNERKGIKQWAVKWYGVDFYAFAPRGLVCRISASMITARCDWVLAVEGEKISALSIHHHRRSSSLPMGLFGPVQEEPNRSVRTALRKEYHHRNHTEFRSFQRDKFQLFKFKRCEMNEWGPNEKNPPSVLPIAEGAEAREKKKDEDSNNKWAGQALAFCVAH